MFLGGHFAPATTGHFELATGGQFASAMGGQFTLKVGGHFHRFFHFGTEILLPCIDEQTKIANFLSAIDEKINQCDMQIVKTEQYKKGLLQQMFV